jgi:succinoglycan biosynthesis transport protein ExoP
MPTPPVPNTPLTGEKSTARDFFTILFRRRAVIVTLFTVTLLTVLVVALTTPMEFESSGRVLYKRGEQTSMLQPNRQLMNDWEQEMGSEIELVRSQAVVTAASKLLSGETAPGRATVQIDPKRLQVEVMGKSNVILIGYRHGDAAVAQRVCDAVLRSYVAYRQDVLTMSYPQRFFSAEVKAVEARMDTLNEERRRFSNAGRGADIVDEQRTLLTTRAVLTEQRSVVQADLAAARADVRAARELQRNPDIDLPVQLSSTSADPLSEIKRHIIEQESRLAQLRERYRDDSPEMLDAQGTLRTLRGMLTREVSARLELMESREQVLSTRLASIDQQVVEVERQLALLPDRESRLAVIDHEIDLLRARHKDMVEKSDLARVNQNTIPRAVVLLLEPAGPATPTVTRDYVRLALAPGFSLLIGLGLAFFIDGLDITIHTARHAEEALELPVLATLTERRRRRA